MNLPLLLKPGSTIGICAPSKHTQESRKKELYDFIEWAESLGLTIKLSDHMFSIDKRGVSSGTPQQRADEINGFFANSNIDAIRCFQGGYAALQVVDLLDYELIKKNPKLFMGKSDIDLLLLAIYQKTGITTIHCPDSKFGRGFHMDLPYSQKRFKRRLFDGETGLIESSMERKTIQSGTAQGKILGCNLGSLSKLVGTEYMPDFTGAILFLEVYSGGAMVHLERLKKLQLGGIFDKISGVVIGYNVIFQNQAFQQDEPIIDRDGTPYQFEDLFAYALNEFGTRRYDFPILKINEFGHYFNNCFLPIGADCVMNADKQTVEIL